MQLHQTYHIGFLQRKHNTSLPYTEIDALPSLEKWFCVIYFSGPWILMWARRVPTSSESKATTFAPGLMLLTANN